MTAFSMHPYTSIHAPIQLLSRLKLKPKPAGDALSPAVTYVSPFKLIDNRINLPETYDGYIGTGTIDYPFRPNGGPASSLSRQFTKAEILTTDEVTLDESAIRSASISSSQLYESGQAQSWGTTSGVPAILASAELAGPDDTTGFLAEQYTGGDPFSPTPTNIESSSTLYEQLLSVPLGLKSKLQPISSEIPASGSYTQNISHIEDFVGYRNTTGDEFYPPEKPRYYTGEVVLGFDSGQAYDLVTDTYKFNITFRSMDVNRKLTGLPVVIEKVEGFGQYAFPFPTGNNTHVGTYDQNVAWQLTGAPSSNLFSEKVTFAGDRFDLELTGLDMVSRVIYDYEVSDWDNFNYDHETSILTHLVTGVGSMYMDRLFKVVANVSGQRSTSWIWFNLTPVLYAARLQIYPNQWYFPSWVRLV